MDGRNSKIRAHRETAISVGTCLKKVRVIAKISILRRDREAKSAA
jgi:hypothetical protein